MARPQMVTKMSALATRTRWRTSLLLYIASGVLPLAIQNQRRDRLSYFFQRRPFDGRQAGAVGAIYAQAAGLKERSNGLQFMIFARPTRHSMAKPQLWPVELSRHGAPAICLPQREAKDHGEGGTLVGAPCRDGVLIIDDVMSAGTAAKIDCHHSARGRSPHAMVLALDETGKNHREWGWM
jgi:orotate phosphoribosyltransferase